MENYEISQKGMDTYRSELDKEEAEWKTKYIDYDDYDFSEPEDEEAFRMQNETINKQIEQDGKAFISWSISQSCQKIAKSINTLEQSIMKKPYYGMMIKYFSKSAKKPIDDIMSIATYECEKRWLDKKLAKQMDLSKK